MVIGEPVHFFENAHDFRDFLRVNCDVEALGTISLEGNSPSEFEVEFIKLLGRADISTTLIIAYTGHGSSSGWGLVGGGDLKLIFRYEALARILRECRGKSLLVVEACHALSVVPVFEEAGVNPELCGVIGICQREEIAKPGCLFRYLKTCWAKSENFKPEAHHTRHIQGHLIEPIIPKVRRSRLSRITIFLNRFFPWCPIVIERIEIDDGNEQTRDEVIYDFHPGRWGVCLDPYFFSRKPEELL